MLSCSSPPHDLPLLLSRSIRNQEQKLLGSERPASACSPAGSMESRLETACNIQVLIVPLCSHVRLHQESCIKQRTKRSEEGDAARGSTQHNLGSACPAQLNSTEVKIIPPSVLFIIIQCQKLLSDAS